ncbi:MAG: NepR family anti-sigma factor [Hyphomicrobiaceae bacterium]
MTKAGPGRQNILNEKDHHGAEHLEQEGQMAENLQLVLPREAQGRIGLHLRRIYGAILSEPLPDKFAELLKSLDKTERS